MLEIKNSQGRGGVWEDPDTGVCWLLVAGLAKGSHLDTDDFYQRIKRQDAQGELDIQRNVLKALRSIQNGGSYVIDVDHIRSGHGRLSSVEITLIPSGTLDLEEEHTEFNRFPTDEIVVDFMPLSQYEGDVVLWQLMMRVLISIEPPHDAWFRDKNSFSNISEPGAWSQIISKLDELVETGLLGESEPIKCSHYTHREHLANKTVEGRGVRSLCGTYFVPSQDHDSMSKCQTCEEIYASLPE